MRSDRDGTLIMPENVPGGLGVAGSNPAAPTI